MDFKISKENFNDRMLSIDKNAYAATVLRFINRFKEYDKNQEVTKTFTSGCCYWFAKILYDRFYAATIMYDQVANHFCVKILDRLYDITGDVTDAYNVTEWGSYDDTSDMLRVVKQCILFLDGEEFA